MVTWNFSMLGKDGDNMGKGRNRDRDRGRDRGRGRVGGGDYGATSESEGKERGIIIRGAKERRKERKKETRDIRKRNP